MQPYDLLMMSVLVGATLLGMYKGVAWQIASLTSLVASYFVALTFSPALAPALSQQEPFNRFLAMLVLYLGTSLVIWVLFGLASKSIERLKLKGFDRQAGGLVGLAKGVVLCLAVTFFAVTLSDDSRQAALDSRSGRYIAELIREARPVLPAEANQVLGPYLEEIDRGLRPEQGPRRPRRTRTRDTAERQPAPARPRVR